jgi:hypothetical protein
MHRDRRMERAPGTDVRGRAVVVVLVLVAFAAVVAWLLAAANRSAGVDGPDRSQRRETTPSAPHARDRGPSTPDAAPSPTPLSAPTAGVADALRDALAHGDAAAQRAAAAALRGLLRTDPAAWSAVKALLLADDTPAALREALAFVLGTIAEPSPDAALTQALAKFGSNPEIARALILALGAKRDFDDDDVFALGDRPWGADGPGALGITVHRRIDDDAVRSTVLSSLRRDEAVVRRAAAVALRHSLNTADARGGFTEALASETSDVVAQELGEALVQTARTSGDAAERARLVGVVLRRASVDEFDGLRFRIEDDLVAAKLGADELHALAELAGTSQTFAKRSFALTVLAGAAHAGGDAAVVRQARALLDAALADDADSAVRDLAARLLAQLPADDGSIALLVAAAAKDAAWNVRYAAVESIANVASPDVAKKALAAAAQDPDPRVADHAKELAAEKR